MRGCIAHETGPILRRGCSTWLVCIYTSRGCRQRASATTVALAVGVSPKIASKQLGYTSVAFTLEVYSHVLLLMQDTAAMKFEELEMAA